MKQALSTKAYIALHREADLTDLALRLRKEQREDAPFILQQIEGWQKLRRKVPHWSAQEDLHYPTRLSLEQCSGAAAAAYKARLVQRLLPEGGAMADLTGGFGVDFVAMAQHFSTAVYMEQNEDLVTLARHNFPLLGAAHAQILLGDGPQHLAASSSPFDLVFIDPARRDGVGRKTVLLEDCTPDITTLLSLLAKKTRHVLLKLSPMLDWHGAVRSLRGVTEVHVFAEKGEVKDLLLVLDTMRFAKSADESQIQIFATDNEKPYAFTAEAEQQATPEWATKMETYLYEPHAALLKAGAFRHVAVRFGLKKLHVNTHLYTSSVYVPNFPGRCFRILRTSGFAKRELSVFKQGVTHAHLAVRNFPQRITDLQRRLGIKEGGTEYWWGTTLSPNQHVLIAAEKVLPPAVTAT